MILKNVIPSIVGVFCFLFVSSVPTFPAAAAAADLAVTHCRLDITVDPLKSRVEGIMEITAKNGRELNVYTNGVRITELLVNGRKVDITIIQDKDEIVLRATGPIKLKYEVSINDSEDNLFSDKDIVLKDGWYPIVDGFCTYEVQAILPRGFIGISEGEVIRTIPQGDKVLFKARLDHPYSDAISLVASRRFIVAGDVLDGIEIYTYFFEEDGGQSARFIAAAKHYLAVYQSIIGEYPYKRLSIVENAMPSAFSMPTFVLMSPGYIRQERIEDTALGHEIVHQWFGNSVYADYERGNWHEGLTIYFADHRDEELQKEDKNCRKKILIGFENYVRDNNVFPLSKFTERFDYASRSIGYGKSAMVFHMLRIKYGDELFYKAVRRFVRDNTFRVASWADIQRAFEITTGDDLALYFKQWVHDVGIPALELADVHSGKKTNGYEISFNVRQKNNKYQLYVPVTFYFREGRKTELLTVKEETNYFQFVFDVPPTEIVVDEYYDVFRKLAEQEIPPTIERLITDEKSIIILSPVNMTLYAKLASAFGDKGRVTTFLKQRPDISRKFERGSAITRKVFLDHKEHDSALKSGKDMAEKKRNKSRLNQDSRGRNVTASEFRVQRLQRKATRLKDGDLAGASLLVMGTDNPLLRRLEIELPHFDTGFGLVVMKNPRNPRKVVAVASGKSQEEINLAQDKITDYRKYSELTFNQGKLVSKTVAKADNGIRVAVTFPEN